MEIEEAFFVRSPCNKTYSFLFSSSFSCQINKNNLNLYEIFMKRYLALDIGQKKTGIAATDTNRIIANALITVPTNELESFLKNYLQENEVEKIIVGMPVQMNNTPSKSVKYIEPVVNRLKKVFSDIEFIFVDERFTSKMAFQTMIDTGLKKNQRRDKTIVDKISATIILQSYLDKEKYSFS
jgi:putative Holliday junction resolvase